MVAPVAGGMSDAPTSVPGPGGGCAGIRDDVDDGSSSTRCRGWGYAGHRDPGHWHGGDAPGGVAVQLSRVHRLDKVRVDGKNAFIFDLQQEEAGRAIGIAVFSGKRHIVACVAVNDLAKFARYAPDAYRTIMSIRFTGGE